MIGGGIYGGIKNIFNPQKREQFIIYDNQVLQAKTKKEQDDYAWLRFDGIIDNNFQNSVNLPTQSLENRQFSNDSIIDNPFTFTVKCAISQAIWTADDINSGREAEIAGTLDFLQKSDILLAILQVYPLFSARTNLHLESYRLPQSNANVGLVAYLTFREIRTSYDPDTINTTTQNNPTDTSGSYVPGQSANPSASGSVDNGFVTPTNPTGDTSSLGQFNSQFGGL